MIQMASVADPAFKQERAVEDQSSEIQDVLRESGWVYATHVLYDDSAVTTIEEINNYNFIIIFSQKRCHGVSLNEFVQKYCHTLPLKHSFTTTITLSMICSGTQVCYQTIDYDYRKGTSKTQPADTCFFLLLVFYRIVFLNPQKVFFHLFSLLFLLGLNRFKHDIFVGTVTKMAIIYFLSVFTLWAIGLLSDQIEVAGLSKWHING